MSEFTVNVPLKHYRELEDKIKFQEAELKRYIDEGAIYVNELQYVHIDMGIYEKRRTHRDFHKATPAFLCNYDSKAVIKTAEDIDKIKDERVRDITKHMVSHMDKMKEQFDKGVLKLEKSADELKELKDAYRIGIEKIKQKEKSNKTFIPFAVGFTVAALIASTIHAI